MECPDCNSKISELAEFCIACGCSLSFNSRASIENLSFDEKLEKIQRYLPKGLNKKILAQRHKIEGERKQVTVMFCDMVGFTILVEKNQIL